MPRPEARARQAQPRPVPDMKIFVPNGAGCQLPGRREPEPAQQPRVPEHHDTGDARGGGGEHHDPERPVDAVGSPLVGRRGGLPVGRGGHHPPLARRAEPGHRGGDGLAAREPDRRRRQLQRGVPAQQPLQGRRVGVLERGDVRLEQGAGGRLGRLGELAAGRGHVAEPGPGPLQRALDRDRGGAEHPGHVLGREGQHLTQQQDRPLPGRQVLEARDQRQPQAVPGDRDDRRVVGLPGHQRVGHRLQPPELGPVSRGPRRGRRGRTAAPGGSGAAGRSGTCWWRSGTARCVPKTGPRIRCRTARPAGSSPAPRPRHRRPSRASGSSAPAARAGMARSGRRTRCP